MTYPLFAINWVQITAIHEMLCFKKLFYEFSIIIKCKEENHCLLMTQTGILEIEA